MLFNYGSVMTITALDIPALHLLTRTLLAWGFRPNYVDDFCSYLSLEGWRLCCSSYQGGTLVAISGNVTLRNMQWIGIFLNIFVDVIVTNDKALLYKALLVQLHKCAISLLTSLQWSKKMVFYLESIKCCMD